ncbi:uncharacterized protein LOC132544999 [Ylistrum balloti]|uniref:uncharacterized protein LOC132544999 n=1 Tax=Ylistrum balloti TaxID=509963 RepID=UPI002905A63E|nr:uncharacterized protein LOC132544999 [Ylistrum balloti]
MTRLIIIKVLSINTNTTLVAVKTTSTHFIPVFESYRSAKFDNISKGQTEKKVRVLSRREHGQWFEQTDTCEMQPDFIRAQLKEPVNTPIYVYNKATDVFVSGSILTEGMWEGDLVNQTRDFLMEDRERVLLDLGSNVGVFSLMAAKIGRKVFSVDILAGNIQRLCASSLAGHFQDQVTIIQNALSDERGNVTYKTYRGNVGGTFVKKLDGVQTAHGIKIIPAILLDDLLEIFKFQKVVIKMDVETFEEQILKGGKKFFTEARVDYLLMEFGYHRTRPSGRSIIEILDKYGMTPMLPSVHDVRNLTDSEIRAWPGYVTWKRKHLK